MGTGALVWEGTTTDDEIYEFRGNDDEDETSNQSEISHRNVCKYNPDGK
jgi:hypothetical protein